ncbi:MAG: pyridoxal-dependent decarboxylase [Candidatus Eremiobacteraeota bacterium]|nr:pyridoxal-dependent decarboxylase [Candidatus Eremiobacteraeota bacterium]
MEHQFTAVAEWVDRYLSSLRDYPVLSRVAPGDILAQLPENAPESGESFDTILADFDAIILPGITHWNHPRFFAYFSTSSAPIAIAAEMLTAALDVKAMLWRTSPAATELEAAVTRWLSRLVGLPDVFEGIMYDTASIAGFTALCAARESLDLHVRERGMTGRDLPRLRVYVTEHTHSHIEKGAIALGIGRENVVRIACDDAFRMDPRALEIAIAADIAAGMRPMCVAATIGTTSTTSCDPVRAIASITSRHRVWLHVDAAYAGAAAILPERRAILDGCDGADSIVLNPHKWLFVPMDLSVLYVRDPEMVRGAFSLIPEYLRTPEVGVRNYMDYGLQLGRRFRALKLWFVLRHFGAEGIRARLREHIALAERLAGWIAAERGWEILAPHPFSVVCFRHVPLGETAAARLDAHNEAILARVNAGGDVFLSHTRIDEKFAIRLAIGNLQTSEGDVALAWQRLREAAI